MAELADARDSKSRGDIRVGSTPTLGTIEYEKYGIIRTFFLSVMSELHLIDPCLRYLIRSDRNPDRFRSRSRRR